MMYPRSPSLQPLPVPGVGFCQSIFVDQDAAHRTDRGLWSFIASPFSIERSSPEPADPPAKGHRLQ
jgi:hypothetical protein